MRGDTKLYIISIYFNQYTLHVLCIHKKQNKNYIYYTCMYYYIYFVLITLFYMYNCCHFKYSVCLLWFYVVSLLYTRLSENSSDELMIHNYHVTDVK